MGKDNDISGGTFGIRRVKGTLAGAYELLQGKLFERAEQIVGQRSGRYPRRMDPEEMSILSGVMGITKEVSLVGVSNARVLDKADGRRLRNSGGRCKSYMTKDDSNEC